MKYNNWKDNITNSNSLDMINDWLYDNNIVDLWENKTIYDLWDLAWNENDEHRDNTLLIALEINEKKGAK